MVRLMLSGLSRFKATMTGSLSKVTRVFVFVWVAFLANFVSGNFAAAEDGLSRFDRHRVTALIILQGLPRLQEITYG
jgi:hypothetical protein